MKTKTNVKRERKPQPKPPDPRTLPPVDLNQRYDALMASAYLKQCLATTRKQIKDGTLQTKREGRRVYVPGAAIAERSRVSSS